MSQEDNIKGHWKSFVNKYKQMAQERRQYQRVIGNPLSINTNKWHKREETISRGHCRTSFVNKYKQMAQINTNKWNKRERETISKGHWKSFVNKYKTNGTREKTISKVGKSFVNKYKQMSQEDNIKGSLNPLSINKTNSTRERQYQEVIGNPLSNKYKQMAQELEILYNHSKYKQMAQRERDNIKESWKSFVQ
ncbi:unnamed protein product [Mytilus edulis]|uniref:Uncharacterized protein n=1 Tax=Mytilus edulis TaxID=6550 RepID=A0A8S3V345_MYTED|nr:unnamed protein product [Mytilus edulis]